VKLQGSSLSFLPVTALFSKQVRTDPVICRIAVRILRDEVMLEEDLQALLEDPGVFQEEIARKAKKGRGIWVPHGL